MIDQIETLKQTLKNGDYTCVISYQNDLYTSKERGVKPLLCGPNELTMLGLDALKDSVLIHVPVETVPGGVFLMKSDK